MNFSSKKKESNKIRCEPDLILIDKLEKYQ